MKHDVRILTMGLFLAAGTAGTFGQIGQTAKEGEIRASGSDALSLSQDSDRGSIQAVAVEPAACKASSLLGSTVKNAEGKEIGKVQDLVFDLEKGEMGYAVLALNGEGNERSVPVPVRALKGDSAGKFVTLNMSESVLAAAESVTDGNWPAADIFAVGGPAEAESGSASSESEPSPSLESSPAAQETERSETEAVESKQSDTED